MLQIAHSKGANPVQISQGGDAGFLPQLDLLALFRICYKQWPLLVGGMIGMMMLGGLYLFTASPSYTASFLIFVSPSKATVLQKQDAFSDRQPDPGLIESQVEILKSDSVALTVVRELKLEQDEEFMKAGGLVSKMIGTIGSLGRSTAPPSQEDLEREAVDRLVAAMRVKRIGVTYVIQVDYISRNAARAAQIANAIADAYTVSELEARYQSTRRAGKWLQDRIAELRQQASTADLAVQKFKADNNIVDTSRGLMSEQQLADVNSQLVSSRAAVAEAKARLDRVVEVSNSDISNATVADALKSDIIQRLRAQYLDLAAKRQDLASKYGANHGAVINLKNQMDEITRAAKEELRRLAESYRSDYEIAVAREKSLRDSMSNLVSQAETTNRAQAALRNLESSAQTYRNLYDAFLQKFEETTHEQSFPIGNARVITPATIPNKPSSPKSLLIMAASSVLGLLIGFGLAIFKEVFGNVFRSTDDVLRYTGLECLGILPNLAKEAKKNKAIWKVESDAEILGGGIPLLRHSVLSPFSRFTETIRNVKVSIDIARGSNAAVVGIISSVPHEGKTTFSSNLALLSAQMGYKTLLIDGDMHRMSLTKSLRPDAKSGLIDYLTGKCDVADVIKRDLITGLDFIPNVLNERQPNVVNLLTSNSMIDLLKSARGAYDYIYIDLPPVVPVVDVKASSHLFDNFIFVVEWGKTSRDVVRDALITAEQIRQKVLGVVMNRADPAQLKRLESYRGSSYGSYYTDSDVAA